jgi:hypothetical protein
MIKRGYRPLKDVLSKLSNDWVINLIVVLFADWIIVYKPIRYMLFYIVYRWEPILLVELRFFT